MSNLELLQNLTPETADNLLSTATMFSESPQLKEKWHVVISSPLIGLQSFEFDDLNSLRREVTKVLPKLTLGQIFIYLGYKLPITTDSSGSNLFTTDLSGNEVSLTENYNTRTPIGDEFGVKQQKIDLDKLL